MKKETAQVTSNSSFLFFLFSTISGTGFVEKKSVLSVQMVVVANLKEFDFVFRITKMVFFSIVSIYNSQIQGFASAFYERTSLTTFIYL